MHQYLAMPSSHRVVALVPPGVPPFELGIVVEVFGLERPELDVPWWYSLAVCTEHPGRREASAGGFGFFVEHGLEALAEADTIVVPGWHGPVSEELASAVRGAGARYVSICSGAFLLAACGLLDGREAATHWRYAERLAAEHPQVRVNPDVLYVDDGDVLTSAGSAAGIDLCLHIVRRDHGSAVANSVARRLVIPPHRDGGQAQLIELPMPPHPDDDPIARVMAWALERLDSELPLEVLAGRAYMSVRTFTRRFGRATGMTPGRWLIEQRVRASLPLLEGGDEPIETVAARVGFGSAATYRHHFAAVMRTSPTGYRRAFFGLPREAEAVAEHG
jgi:AraC family transcriptional activator FtrA